MHIPQLFDLLDDGPVTLALGAGSSKDYGLPDWAELKEQIISSLDHNADILNISANHLEDLRTALSMGTENTLDKIASEIFNPEAREAFQMLIVKALLESEKKSADVEGEFWIERFCETLKDYLKNADRNGSTEKSYDKRREKLATLRVVSLNYDRVFFHRLRAGIERVFSEAFLTWQEIKILKWQQPLVTVTISQPHGTLGRPKFQNTTTSFEGLSGSIYYSQALVFKSSSISPYGETQLSFGLGDVDTFETKSSSIGSTPQNELNIVSVDDFIPGANIRAFQASNKFFEKAHVISIGLSELGFNQSLLDFSKAKSVTFTNKFSEIEKFDSTRLPAQEKLCLSEGGIYATPLISAMNAHHD